MVAAPLDISSVEGSGFLKDRSGVGAATLCLLLGSGGGEGGGGEGGGGGGGGGGT